MAEFNCNRRLFWAKSIHVKDLLEKPSNVPFLGEDLQACQMGPHFDMPDVLHSQMMEENNQYACILEQSTMTNARARRLRHSARTWMDRGNMHRSSGA